MNISLLEHKVQEYMSITNIMRDALAAYLLMENCILINLPLTCCFKTSSQCKSKLVSIFDPTWNHNVTRAFVCNHNVRTLVLIQACWHNATKQLFAYQLCEFPNFNFICETNSNACRSQKYINISITYNSRNSKYRLP